MLDKMLIATVTSKGQITIPSEIRKILNIASKGDLVGFISTQEGIIMKHLKVTEAKKDFNEEEWGKLEKLAANKGKTYKSAKDFLKAIKKL